jgi:hypothetical protein
VNYRPRKITEAAAGLFATPDYQEADIAGPFCAPFRLARPGGPAATLPKSGQLADVLWQTDSRPRIALLQSLIGINQDHVRMTTGSGPLIYRAAQRRTPRNRRRAGRSGRYADAEAAYRQVLDARLRVGSWRGR